MIDNPERVYLAIAEAVREAVDVVGVDGIRNMSMFPSAGFSTDAATEELEAA